MWEEIYYPYFGDEDEGEDWEDEPLDEEDAAAWFDTEWDTPIGMMDDPYGMDD